MSTVAAALLVLVACTTDDAPSATPTQAPPPRLLPLQLHRARSQTRPLRASRHPSRRLHSRSSCCTHPTWTARSALDNVEAFSALLDGFRAEFPGRTIVLSSGDDYVRGPRFYTAADVANDPLPGVSGNGRGDIALLNAMDFQASAIGNHELDLGSASFASIVAPETGERRDVPRRSVPVPLG